MRLFTFRNIRIALLAVILAVVGLSAKYQSFHSRNWAKTLEIVILPINAEGGSATELYIESLQDSHFKDINLWFSREAKRYGLDIEKPVDVRLGPTVVNHPPDFPGQENPLKVLFWGLRFRWWVWRNTPDIDSTLTQIRIFVMYYQGEDGKPLQHSLGMEKGLLGLVHAYADHKQTKQNNIVIAHEMLHTVGAIDKYVAWGAPVYPAGYADPHRTPLFPQRNAEIMAGRIPVSHQKSYMAESLRSVLINSYTAREINWIK